MQQKVTKLNDELTKIRQIEQKNKEVFSRCKSELDRTKQELIKAITAFVNQGNNDVRIAFALLQQECEAARRTE